MIDNNIIIDSLITIDESGMPVPPNVRQLIDKDVRELYRRDSSKNKSRYIQEAIVIYYLGDPKSPAKSAGMGDAEALEMAKEQADLPKDYLPDALVIRLIKKYHDRAITEAGKVIENILQGIHNVNLAIDAMNGIINEKLRTRMEIEEATTIMTIVDSFNKKASEIPNTIKKLEEAKENLMYEKENDLARGGSKITSSMNADNY